MAMTHQAHSVSSRSCSRRNFAPKFEVTFDKETRSRSNVAGKLGKLKLNHILIDYIKSLVFQHFPVEESETHIYFATPTSQLLIISWLNSPPLATLSDAAVTSSL